MGNINDRLENKKKNLMKDVTPHDLVKFGLIPELVGRLPVLTSLNELDEEALVRILTEPKNCLVDQYKKLFDLDTVDLEFEQTALNAIAQQALERKTGARGLRSILEGFLMPLMFEVPKDHTIEKVVITKATVEDGADPELVRNEDRKPVQIQISARTKRKVRKNTAL